MSRNLLVALASWIALVGPARADGPTYVGSAACASCHAEATRQWQGSHHDLAMQPASESTVIGDFNDVRHTHQGITSRFFRRDDRFLVHTEGPGGKMQDFEIAYTFGVEPLQQYLIRFDDGRMQALGLAWDSRGAKDGGGRWFAVYGDEPIPHDDVLHWTKLSQNWNHMCAECHSTNLRKRYDGSKDSFDTTWSEIDVACEACHGPGSLHRDRMAGGEAKGREPGATGLTVEFPSIASARWERSENTANAVRRPVRNEHFEVELCARCHSRRETLEEGVDPGRSIHESHRISRLEAPLYHADGQILDEVYVYGSFVQSAMYEAGVTCSDCHDPHTTKLRAEGNTLCVRCHAPEHYDTESHHHHPKASQGARCVECHMPTQTYMQIDTRRDHSLRVPRPDLSNALGTPNACNACHSSMTPAWAAQKIASWRGPTWRPPGHYGSALHAAQNSAVDAEQRLASVLRDPSVPAIAQATAIAALPRFASQSSMSLFPEALADADPMVRTAAIEALEGIDAKMRVQLIAPLLEDPVRAVRREAARVLAGLPNDVLDPKTRKRRNALLDEYRAAQERDGDRPQAHMRLAALAIAEGQFELAEQELGLARDRNPSFLPAYVNLADLHRSRGMNAESERVLRAALTAVPGHPDVRHALGLALVRLDRHSEALAEFTAAALAAPENPRYAYVYAIAVHDAGDVDKARSILRAALERHPGDRELRAFLSRLEGRP